MSDIPGIATRADWDAVYRTLFAPAIRAAGFVPIRSRPTRGNLVKGIIKDLWSADAVLADLTGQKANVFYEIGVRHALQGRTIIIARDSKDIPFDLRSYAWHIYNPKSNRGVSEFRTAIRRLLRHILAEPDEPDNPVGDFLDSSQRVHGRLRLAHLNGPQRKASVAQVAQCEQVLADIYRGRIPIPAGTAEYFNYFIELINAGDACEHVRVFLSKMDDGSLRYDRAASRPLFAPFKRAVRSRKMRIEYIGLFESRDHYARVNGWRMLDRHSDFSYSVRKVFLDELSAQPLQTDKTIVLLETRKWAITHTWNKQGIIKDPILLTGAHDFELLRHQYNAIRAHSYSYAR
jgi:hypothetical protein